ncbi:MAG: efflux RND transporter periplasmic adaptor subunit, partial [Gammaproteobacteria bacterium]|nr:efflux RND transporter periplasmic adaptor subunit [Gammaproteobacteria bacterium]
MKNLLQRHGSVVYALAIMLLLTLWLASGYLASDDGQSTAADTPSRSMVQKVRVRSPVQRRVIEEVVLNGRTEPSRAVTFRAEVEGRVIALKAKQGAAVRAGDVIVQFDSRDREARLAQALALRKQRKLEYDGARELLRQNLQSEIQLAQAATQLESAGAQVAAIELEIRNTRVTAPFDGILNRLPVEVGSYLNVGDEIGRLLELDPAIFVGYVSQHERNRLVLGDKGIARFVTGMVAEGELRYVAAEADPVTRTFRVELEIPNPDGSLVSGLTAEVRIPVRYVSAFVLSPALLSLNASDVLGIKVVNSDDRVEFMPVEVVRSTAEGLWISGLPEDTRIITVGQVF